MTEEYVTPATRRRAPEHPITDDADECSVLTVGHSTRPIEKFLELLTAHGVVRLVDVRTVPRSRHNPQFNSETLRGRLAGVNIAYEHAPGLGGFRRPVPNSANAGWRNLSFRGYADYMQTEDFARNLDELVELTQAGRIALMCAEAVPWRCHRSLIADALLVKGVRTCEVLGTGRLQARKLTPFAQVCGMEITYPPPQAESRD